MAKIYFLLQIYAFNGTDSAFLKFKKRLITTYPIKIHQIANKFIGKHSLIERAVFLRQRAATRRLLKLGCFCPLVTQNTPFSSYYFHNKPVQFSFSNHKYVEMMELEVFPEFMRLHLRITYFMKDFTQNRWNGLSDFLQEGLVNVTLPGTALTALSIAIQYDRIDIAAKLLQNGAHLGSIKQKDSAAHYLFTAWLNSPKRENTRNSLEKLLAETHEQQFFSYLFLYFVEEKDVVRVSRMGQQKEFSLEKISSDFGSPVCLAAENICPKMLQLLSQFHGFNVNQKDSSGCTALDLAIRKLYGEKQMLKENIGSSNLRRSNIDKLVSIISFLLRNKAHLTPCNIIDLFEVLLTTLLAKIFEMNASIVRKMKELFLLFFIELITLDKEFQEAHLRSRGLKSLFQTFLPLATTKEVNNAKSHLINLTTFVPSSFFKSYEFDNPQFLFTLLSQISNSLPDVYSDESMKDYGSMGGKFHISGIITVLINKLLECKRRLNEEEKVEFKKTYHRLEACLGDYLPIREPLSRLYTMFFLL